MQKHPLKLLLIGGTGVLSSAVARRAMATGLSVTMINRGSRPAPEGAERLVCDCRDLGAVEALLVGRRFDAVIDFLSWTADQLRASFPLYSPHCSQYVFISTSAVYDTRVPGWKSEDAPKVNPLWDYSGEKWDCERLLAELAVGSPCRTTVIRPSITYDDTRIPYGVMPRNGTHWTLAARILAGKPVVRWNGGVARWNMTRAEDFAVGCVGLVGNERAFGEAFNVCGDETPSFAEVIDTVAGLLGKKAVAVDVDAEFYAKEIPRKAGEILGGRSLDSLDSNARLKSAVPEFRQTIGLREGIARTLDAYRRQNYQLGIDWTFDAETDRTIRNWCLARGIDPSRYNLAFTDYLGTATEADRKTYSDTMLA